MTPGAATDDLMTRGWPILPFSVGIRLELAFVRLKYHVNFTVVHLAHAVEPIEDSFYHSLASLACILDGFSLAVVLTGQLNTFSHRELLRPSEVFKSSTRNQ